MSKLSPARKLALDVLMEADRRGMYARDVLSSRASAKAIDQRDSAFAARLALGVAATQGILDELLDQFLDVFVQNLFFLIYDQSQNSC